MGSVRSGLPVELAIRLRDELGLEAAVETGTFYGNSAAELARLFDRVWTVELSKELWLEAQRRHPDAENVVFMHGGSHEVLPALDIGRPALYWLDGHWSVGETAGEDLQCPVEDEIRAIDSRSSGERSAILIDDARLFLAPPGPPLDRSQWPTLMDVADLLRAKTDRFVTILEDVIIAVPQDARTVVEDYGMSVAWAPPPASLGKRAKAQVPPGLRKILKSALPGR